MGANQNAQKLLSTELVNTKPGYSYTHLGLETNFLEHLSTG